MVVQPGLVPSSSSSSTSSSSSSSSTSSAPHGSRGSLGAHVLAPPTVRQRSRELLLGRDLTRLVVGGPRLRRAPRGDGAPVVLVPGFGATDRSLVPLRRFLQGLGHDMRSAGLGRVTDDVEAQYAVLGRRCAAIAAETGRRVSVVGWSIGGVLAREAARDDPASIARVVTFGTPVEGGPSYTALAVRYSADELAHTRARIEERSAMPIAVPVTAIRGRNDGIVSPAACIDRRTPHAENIEVSSTHIGMGLDPDVWMLIARRLAAAPGPGPGPGPGPADGDH